MATSHPTTPDRLAQTIAELDIDSDSPLPPAVQKAVQLARVLQSRGSALQTPQERRQQRELERMMDNPLDKATLMQLTDQAFRSKTPQRAADQLIHILDVQGIPRFFTVLDRAMLKGFQSFGGYLPGVSVPMVKSKMREETANVILPAETELLVEHLKNRRDSGVRMNVNYLGEALLGEKDARSRLENYLAALQLPELECISVKVSTVYSQIMAIARDKAIRILCDRMELLYRASARSRYERPNGTVVPKFVYLDMEEYRDLDITVETFIHTLGRPGLEGVNAGIALQAYLPDSFRAQQRITEWAVNRVSRGGSPVTIRIVKGANLEAERVEASIAGWPQAPFPSKRDTDANYKRMLQFALEPEHIEAVHVGVASHNLFDVSYGLVMASERGVLDKVQFEMLEGMANHQRRALHELADNVLLYAPATRKDEFVNAIGYLVRRLDENTGADNFLRHAFRLEVDNDDWKTLEADFVASFEHIENTLERPRRTQKRGEPVAKAAGAPVTAGQFDNEPHTDFALAHNVAWAKEIISAWKPRCGDRATEIPLVVAGEEITAGGHIRECLDPSRPGVVVGRYRQADTEHIDRALECARQDPAGWRQLDEADRAKILAQVAQEMRRARGDLMGAAMADGGKLFTESDPEVSEAIDFVEYYAATARDFRAMATVDVEAKGVVVVVPPWNFPIAIPCGGVSAALAAGNTVILKPASHTVLVAHELCKCFWRAGVPRQALQLLPCSGASGGARLVASSDVDVVILTGGTDTALRMLEARPEMNLLAETGGKNGTIVTAMSDREQAIKHVVYSAFGHSGQKCSATSLLVLEAEVYDDPNFKATLCDAVESMEVGSAWELSTKMGPVIHAPTGDLERSQKELEDGESWAVIPRQSSDNANLWTPGVKWGVRPGSYTHLTEFFGPVLAVLRADDLEHAIDIVNHTGYGLTSGIETLDEREQEIWRDRIGAGNLYINRVTTGAIVLRQPFGGMGKSAFGPGIKAGGPNYVAQLMSFRDRPLSSDVRDEPVDDADVDRLREALVGLCKTNSELAEGVPTAELRRVLYAIASYADAFKSEFGAVHDHFRLVGQDNLRRYLPVRALRIRVHPDDTPFELFARVCAARIVRCGITVSMPHDFDSPALDLLDRLTDSWGAAVEFVEESDTELAEVVRTHQTDRVRYASDDRAPHEVLGAIGDTGIFIARTPVLVEGRIELLWYVREQSISHDYHRYGNLGPRASEKRRPVL
ncbi:MAG: bifunctional proline dehydrogenase/L-glutamate gamma-semialdehyde dehydrogenase [Proteobacteria bacterium]|nr:bifunctional proline dehydrogenase/L-glutamate gamma-semialdehyde dehydrogenase [Pseudomonadota bacterium]